MSTLARFGRALSGAVDGFLHADTPDGDLIGGSSLAGDTWGDVEARRFRYALAWSLYQNTAYRDVHEWSSRLRAAFGLYFAVRNLRCPVDRIVEFAAAHIYGGGWDADAGDGKDVPSAAPIVGDAVTPAMRAGIARVWRDSLWPLNVECWVRNGALYGDSPAKVVLDRDAGKVLFEVIHPKTVKWAAFDRMGHVQGYAIERVVDDPRRDRRPDPTRPTSSAPKRVIYEERCYRGEGEEVAWETFLVDGGDARPWDWTRGADEQADGVPAWTAPYGFVPMVWTRHVDAGLGFGLAEWHTAWQKIADADDQASKLNDQIRKVVDPKWLFTGMKAPTRDANGRSRLEIGPNRRSLALDDETERDAEGALYARDATAKAQALVADLPIDEALENLNALVEEIERGFPELRFDRLRANGEVSGEALRVARQPCETKIGRRRLRYDTDLVRLQQMALAIGGHAYRELGRDSRLAIFSPFSLESYAAGDLDHQIGPRPVFGEDPFEQAARRTAVYAGVQAAVNAGIPKRIALREAGYSDEQIDEMDQIVEAESVAAAERFRRAREAAGSADPAEMADDAEDEVEVEGKVADAAA
jgi:hypothetical protein